MNVAVNDGGCPTICEVPDSDKAKFDSVIGQVDYARYCLKSCRGVSGDNAEEVEAAEHLICANNELFVGAGRGPGAAAAAAQAAALAAPTEEREAVGRQEAAYTMPAEMPDSTVPTEMPVSDAALRIAKSAMLEAKRHAEAAGQGAKAARQAYEAVVASIQVMGEAAGKATLDEMQHAAAVQAAEALEARRRYEQEVQQNAWKASQDAAMVYQKAKHRNMVLVASWRLRAHQFRAAAAERGDAARLAEGQAVVYKNETAYDLAKEFAAKAKAAEEMSEMYTRREVEAEAQAEKIEKASAWYDYAAQAAAANALVGVLPPGIPPR